MRILVFSVRRNESIQRKVSSISDRSDTSEPGAASGGEESPGILRYFSHRLFFDYFLYLYDEKYNVFFINYQTAMNHLQNLHVIQMKLTRQAKHCRGQNP